MKKLINVVDEKYTLLELSFD